jgi:hypothetical protein
MTAKNDNPPAYEPPTVEEIESDEPVTTVPAVVSRQRAR